MSTVVFYKNIQQKIENYKTYFKKQGTVTNGNKKEIANRLRSFKESEMRTSMRHQREFKMVQSLCGIVWAFLIKFDVRLPCMPSYM